MPLRTEQRKPASAGLGKMTRLYLVKTGQTTWEQQRRVESAVGEPLTDRGKQEIDEIGCELEDLHIKAVYAGVGEAESETAKLLAARLGLKLHSRKDLRELDYGLWQGLTAEEIKRRQPKVYRQWASAPGSVRPPDGETLLEVQQRLRSAARRIVKRHKGEAAVVVCRPVALGVLKCTLTKEPLDTLWEHVGEGITCTSYDTDERGL
jgi:broad specificity phosphatase PhoE